jgi:exosortase E/protease (VPEID-CTERM system)
MGLTARLGAFAVTLFAEKFFLNFFIDISRADLAGGAGAKLRLIQHLGFRFAVPFTLALVLFVAVRGDSTLEQLDRRARTLSVNRRWLVLHGTLIAILAATLTRWYGSGGVRLPLVAVSVCIAGGALVSLLAALAPLELWRRGAAALGMRWLYAAAAAAVASAAFSWSQDLWEWTARVTFGMVRLLLIPLIPSLHADGSTRILATRHFAIYVAPYCSGLEGVALMLAFCSAWLIYFRKEYIFPRAFLLIPASLLLIFALNAVRIATLMLIGNAGYPAIALYGFHSQAGWIAFNCAACGVAFVSRRSPWFSASAGGNAAAATAPNPTAAYLMPFLTILAAGMLARAASGRFETWYALRLLAAAAAFAFYWPQLSRLDWRFGWRGPAAGMAIFALWLAAGHLILAPQSLPAALAALSAPARDLWIASRAATAILVLPVAGELAYRGYLLRRLVGKDFEAVPFRSVGWGPLLVTAVAFGAVHGALWLPAIAAGTVYGMVLVRTGRLGEAVAAHATLNGLLAAWVLFGGHWQFW